MPSYVPLRLRLKRSVLAVACAFVLYAFHLHSRIRDVNLLPTNTTEEDLTVYNLPNSFVGEPSHLTPIDPTTLIELGTESIDAAHMKGILHTGGVMYVMDSSGRILIMKRSSSVVTCPDTWSIVGEHSIAGEDANDLPIRALEEELGLKVTNRDVKIQALTEFPLYYIRHYGARNGNRVDRQLTYLWLVKLAERHEEISWKIDHEVAGVKWITLDEFDVWLKEDEKIDSETTANKLHYLRKSGDDGPPNGDFCHETIRTLLRLGVEQLKTVQ